MGGGGEVILLIMFVIFWEQSGQAGVENGICWPHIYSDILQSAPFRSKIFEIFFASGGKGALTPNQNPADVPDPTQLLYCKIYQASKFSCKSNTLVTGQPHITGTCETRPVPAATASLDVHSFTFPAYRRLLNPITFSAGLSLRIRLCSDGLLSSPIPSSDSMSKLLSSSSDESMSPKNFPILWPKIAQNFISDFYISYAHGPVHAYEYAITQLS